MYTDLGKKIKEERLLKGLTQEELGEKIESTGAYIGQIERGERMASLSKIFLIASELNVSIDYLMGNKCDYINTIDNDLSLELTNITNNQKKIIIEIVKIIKKYN